jgi:hypothetical protein
MFSIGQLLSRRFPSRRFLTRTEFTNSPYGEPNSPYGEPRLAVGLLNAKLCASNLKVEALKEGYFLHRLG